MAPLTRWVAGHTLYGVPQAAAPIAFGLLALPLTGSATSGAALVFAMTTAAVLGSVPVARAGRRLDGVTYLRLLLVVRGLGLGALTVLAALGAPLPALVAAVVVAGAVNAAAYGYLRLLLNRLVDTDRLPRALGVAATLTEVTFAASPLLASLLGAVSPVAAMAVVTALGTAPLLLVPRVDDAHDLQAEPPGHSPGRLPAAVWLWLGCAVVGGGAVAAVEVGAVSFALSFGLDPALAFVFALALCVGSVAGGVVVSVRNRLPSPWHVTAYLATSTAGTAAVVADRSLALTLAGAGVIGFVLPMLSTFYSLALDALSPAHRRAEVFALLRTASAVGIIAVSGVLALLGLRAAVVGSLVALSLATLVVGARAATRPVDVPAPGA